MLITEVRVKLTPREHKVLAYVSWVFDGWFVVRDVRIVSTINGVILSMPHRVLSFHCIHCGKKNPHSASYCNNCGAAFVPEDKIVKPFVGCDQTYIDLCHPINRTCRSYIEGVVFSEYELLRSYVEREGEWCPFCKESFLSVGSLVSNNNGFGNSRRSVLRCSSGCASYDKFLGERLEEVLV